jgi:lipoprotein-releasing system permease protein
MNGFDRELKNRVLGMIPQATVSSTQILTDWPELAKKLKVIRMSRVLHLLSYKAC